MIWAVNACWAAEKVGNQNVLGQPGSENCADGRYAAEQNDDQRQDGIGQAGAVGAALLGQVLAVDGDERRGQRAAGDEDEEDLRQLVGSREGVELRRCAEGLGHEAGAEKTDDFAKGE